MTTLTVLIKRLTCAALSLAVLLCTAAVGLTPQAATLQDKQSEAQRVQEQLNALKGQSEQIASEYSQQLSGLESVNFLIADNTQKLEKAQGDYEQSKKILGTRIRAIYIEGEVNSVEVLLESTSIDDMLSRYDFLNHIAGQDLDIFKEMKDLRREIAVRQRDLEDQRNRQQQAVAQIQQKQMELQASLAAQEKLLASVNAEVLQLMSQSGGNSGSSSGSATSGNTTITSFVFPVRGTHTYTNDWHEPRAVGGVHMGTDIFASMGTPCVACVAGSVSTGVGKNAGNYIRLSGDDGNVYYYMHLQKFGQTGRVSAGTVVGYVGDTGNAQGTPPHLHFEIHPGGGSAVNPYPILKQYDR